MWFKNGQSKFQPLARVDNEKIDELISAYLSGDEEYRYEVAIPEQFSALEQEYRLVSARLELLKMQQDDIKEQLLKMMEANKQKSIKTSYASYAYVAASTTKRFDSKQFKEENPDEYKKYITEDNLDAIINRALEEAEKLWASNPRINMMVTDHTQR